MNTLTDTSQPYAVARINHLFFALHLPAINVTFSLENDY